eukprot:TRINITY_DN108988_c0_g1_i1.p1 TRINITY_DN108988_c0_g1~~TRINITY_DN108988_c0_g1_i1.p1  ORF type:complete len:729 (+),score=153.05 TRINITY_DN108988_c0_g1_i1:129-2315(+)
MVEKCMDKLVRHLAERLSSDITDLISTQSRATFEDYFRSQAELVSSLRKQNDQALRDLEKLRSTERSNGEGLHCEQEFVVQEAFRVREEDAGEAARADLSVHEELDHEVKDAEKTMHADLPSHWRTASAAAPADNVREPRLSTSSAMSAMSIEQEQVTRRDRRSISIVDMSRNISQRMTVSAKVALASVSDSMDNADNGEVRAMSRAKACSYKVINSRGFEGLTCFMIVLNSLTIGLEANYMVIGWPSAGTAELMSISENIFLGYFTLEILLRIYVYGFQRFIPSSIANIWSFIDLAIVVMSITDSALLAISSGNSADQESPVFRSLTAARSIRLLRLVRIARKMDAFREVWLLFRGMVDSMRVLFWTVVVILVITYFFAIVGLVLIVSELKAQHNDAVALIEKEQLAFLLDTMGSLDRLMYFLIQVLTLDSFHQTITPTVEHVPGAWLFFYAYICLGVFVLLNLVTAIIVENASATARNDYEQVVHQKEAEQKHELQQLQGLFILMDQDGDGTLTWEEFKDNFDNPQTSLRWRMMGFNIEDCHELFQLLDEGDGSIATHEFFAGLQRIRGTALSKDIFRLMKATETLHKQVNEFIENQQNFAQRQVGAQRVARPSLLIQESEAVQRVRSIMPGVSMPGDFSRSASRDHRRQVSAASDHRRQVSSASSFVRSISPVFRHEIEDWRRQKKKLAEEDNESQASSILSSLPRLHANSSMPVGFRDSGQWEL